MPPKQTITEKSIINAAFNLVRKKGISALSARNIAKALSCSTQPVYSSFKTMKELENKVIERSFDFILKTCLTTSTYSNDPFFNMGLGYIQLAKKDPQLFDMIYLSEHTQKLFGSSIYPNRKKGLVQTMKKDPLLNKLDSGTLIDILSHMWTYTHGLAMLARANPDLSDSIIHDRLHEMGRILINSKLQEQGIEPNETHCH